MAPYALKKYFILSIALPVAPKKYKFQIDENIRGMVAKYKFAAFSVPAPPSDSNKAVEYKTW